MCRHRICNYSRTGDAGSRLVDMGSGREAFAFVSGRLSPVQKQVTLVEELEAVQPRLIRYGRIDPETQDLAPRPDESNFLCEYTNSRASPPRPVRCAVLLGWQKKKMKTARGRGENDVYACRYKSLYEKSSAHGRRLQIFGNEKYALLTRGGDDAIHAEVLDQLSVMVGDMPNGSGYSRQPVVAPVFSVHRLQQIADIDGGDGPVHS